MGNGQMGRGALPGNSSSAGRVGPADAGGGSAEAGNLERKPWSTGGCFRRGLNPTFKGDVFIKATIYRKLIRVGEYLYDQEIEVGTRRPSHAPRRLLV